MPGSLRASSRAAPSRVAQVIPVFATSATGETQLFPAVQLRISAARR